MRTVELFCGTKSFSMAATRLGHSTFTVDNDLHHNPDLCINVLALEASQLPHRPDMLWASPPCEAFSVASIGYHWNPDRTPRTERALIAQEIVRKTISLIREISPRWWFVENPRGMLRALPLLAAYQRRTISYCQYGDLRMKPTDIWTNASWWQPRPLCRPQDACHESAPRGARTGTQGIASAARRARIPSPLFSEIFTQLPQRIEEARDV